jgi:D-alanyl-D-alanine carboxypeptidase
MHDPERGLSVHAWGIAIDLNAASNKPGSRGDMDERVIKIFCEHGFYWGGNFGDPMHFQFAVGY